MTFPEIGVAGKKPEGGLLREDVASIGDRRDDNGVFVLGSRCSGKGGDAKPAPYADAGLDQADLRTSGILAEILRYLRNHDYSDRYKEYFTLSPDISTRDRDGINKTFSGLMKILYTRGDASKDEIEELLAIAMEGRKRVKDQLLRIDSTYPKVRFAYRNDAGQEKAVTTLEEQEYPDYYRKTVGAGGDETTPDPDVRERHLTFHENQKGISFDTLMGPYLRGAKKITVTDPYIWMFHQIRNLMEFLETVIKNKDEDEEVAVHLVTVEHELKGEQQNGNFGKIRESCGTGGISFTWEFCGSGAIHARHIATDTGWKISLDRGLDIFQHYDTNDTLSLANRLQRFRPCKAFEATFIRMKPEFVSEVESEVDSEVEADADADTDAQALAEPVIVHPVVGDSVAEGRRTGCS